MMKSSETRNSNTADGCTFQKYRTKALMLACVFFTTVVIVFVNEYERPTLLPIFADSRLSFHANHTVASWSERRNNTDSNMNFQYNNFSVTTERELQSLDVGDDIFSSLVILMRKIRSRWLYGRITARTKYFDGEYTDLSNQARKMLRWSESQRWSRLTELSKAVRERIVKIQNPVDCDTAKMLVCDISPEASGFGSKMHLIVREFIRSIYSNRTFVLKSKGWAYVEEDWEYYLQPFGKCKYDGKLNTLPLLSEKTQHERIVVSNRNIGDIDWAVPENVLRVLEKIHDDPFAWWVAQFVDYAFRFQPWFEEKVRSIGESIGHTKNVAGIQIRWGDKIGREAAKHEVNEYMDFVEMFYRWRELLFNETQRVVYVATESSQAWKDLQSKYPEYTFIGSGFVDDSKGISSKHFVRYSNIKNALPSVLIDMYFLSKSNFVVCTYSSNICRAIYELLMTNKDMPSDRLISLDHYYQLASNPRYRAIQDHSKRNENELDMKVGDQLDAIFDISYKVYDGNIKATNKRTGQKGYFPPYKAEIMVKALKCDVFEDM